VTVICNLFSVYVVTYGASIIIKDASVLCLSVKSVTKKLKFVKSHISTQKEIRNKTV
jgi:hypothetical protein